MRRTTLEALARQEAPFENVVERLEAPRDLSRPPVFQVMLAFQNIPGFAPRLHGVRAEALPVHSATSRFELTLVASRTPQGTACDLEYDTDLFEATTISRFIGHFKKVLEEAIRDPERSITSLDLLTPAERQHLVEVDGDAGSFSGEFLDLREQARSRRDAVAVEFGEKCLTYGELALRVGRSARHLERLGVGPEVRVGICVERSLEMVVSVLAVFEAGGVWVPLDPGHPRQRLEGIVGECRLWGVLGHGCCPSSQPSPQGEREFPWLRLTARPTDRVRTSHLETLAYVIYTSGSTGRPKGVQVTRRALANFLASMARRPGLTAGERLVAVTTLSFDISCLELLLPLAVGARLVVADRDTATDGSRLRRLLEERKATVLQGTPATWRLLLDSGWNGTDGLRMLCGGEALSPDLARRLDATGGELWNLYGPTETTVWSTTSRVRGAKIDLGSPIDNTRLRLLDRYARLVPFGAVGEIHLGGHGLARGYFERPALTAETFVPDPFEDACTPLGAGGEKCGERLYRTGDLARRLSLGRLEYLGRRDHQVKVRGFRVELGEVEAALTATGQVRSCVVVTRGGALAAYVVGKGSLDPGVLRGHLAQRLPAYMVPSAFVALDRLPLTASGKVDRAALPEPSADLSARAAAADELEAWLCQLYAEILKRPAVGVDEDFFELGGHSLLASRLVARLREAVGVEVELRDVFENPRVNGLARLLIGRSRGADSSPILPTPLGREAPLSSAQERLWFLHQLEPGAAYNLPTALRLRGPLDVVGLGRAFAELSRRHASLRTVFPDREGRPAQVVRPAEEARLPVIEVCRESSVRKLVDGLVRRVFDLERGPLVRALLFRLGEDDHVLALSLHHLVADGASLVILLRELAQAYRRRELPDLELSYADFARWERDRLVDTRYWTQELEGATDLALPTDRRRPAVASSRGGCMRFELPAELTVAVRELGRNHNATLFMTLLAGLQACLSRWTGQDDLCVGTPVSGRRPEVEGVVGLFVNTVVLRGDISGGPSVGELVSRARDTVLGALAHQDEPFSRVVEDLGLPRNTSRSPLFQVMLVWQPEASPPEWPLEAEAFSVETATSPFDLTLSFAESGQGLRGELEYSAELFDRTSVLRLQGHLCICLEALAVDADRPVSEILMTTVAERHQLLVEWNAEDVGSTDETLVDLFERQFELRRDAVAVVFCGVSLSYGELDVRSRRQAGELRRLGIGPESRVGVCLEASVERVLASVAVLRAGAALLPLEPSHPSSRIEYQIADAKVSVNRGEPREVGQSPPHPSQTCLPDYAAYVIYTSGSTGQPKGVEVSHRAAVSVFHAWDRAYTLAGRRYLQAASWSFDVAVGDLIRTLGSGVTLVLVAEEDRLDASVLYRRMLDARVDSVEMVPALARQLLRFAESSGLSLGFLDLAVLGGDVATPADLVGLAAHGVRTFNSYGVTEAAIDSAYLRFNASRWNTAPIGRPFANTELYVLDRRLAPVSVGVLGELVIGGRGLARGYLGCPASSAERFVPNLFSPPGLRLYRTGDVVRILCDGNVDFLGRVDHQVKVRGYRVEVEEIEAVLGRHASVADCAVVVRTDGGGEPLLVAFVVVVAGHPGFEHPGFGYPGFGHPGLGTQVLGTQVLGTQVLGTQGLHPGLM